MAEYRSRNVYIFWRWCMRLPMSTDRRGLRCWCQRRAEVATHQQMTQAAAAAATTFNGRIYPSVCTESITCHSILYMLKIETQEGAVLE